MSRNVRDKLHLSPRPRQKPYSVLSTLASNSTQLMTGIGLEKQLVTGSFKGVNKESATCTCSSNEDSEEFTLKVPLMSSNRTTRSVPSTPEKHRKFPTRNAESANCLELMDRTDKPSTSSAVSVKSDSSPYTEKSPRFKSRNDKFHRIFKSVGQEETVLNYYSCAYCGDILLQGMLYISKNWFCFYSKILGKEKVIEIPVGKVLKITREKTAFIIPNAIGIHTGDGKYVFGSLISRDSAYKLMTSTWRGSQITDKMESEDDLADDVIGDVIDGAIETANDNSVNNNSIDLANTVIRDTEQFTDSPCDPSHDPSANTARTRIKSATSDSNKPIAATNGSHIPVFLLPIKCWFAKKCAIILLPCQQVLQSAPTIYLLLAACLFMVLFLLLSAIIMSSKLISLQSRLDDQGVSDKTIDNSIDLQSNVYTLNQHLHTSTVERFHSVLRANIKVLDEVHNSLLALHKSASHVTVSCSKDSIKPKPDD